MFLFQLTLLKYIWSLEKISRISNLLCLGIVTLFGVYALLGVKYPKRLWKMYLFPALLIYIGMMINISINVMVSQDMLSQYGRTLPWATFLIIPYLCKNGLINSYKLWKYSYYIMLCFSILGLIEYYSIYYKENETDLLVTPFRVYLGGKFSVIMLSGGFPGNRLYSFFIEPGTYAMILLPFIIYSYLNKKYIGLGVFLIALYFTHSLGGLIGLTMVAVLLFYYENMSKFGFLATFFIMMLGIVVSFPYVAENLGTQYKNKGYSATQREQNIEKGIENLPKMIYNYPLGIRIQRSTDIVVEDELYSGSNFIPINYLQTGGIFSFVGYITIVIMSLYIAMEILFHKSIQSNDYITVALSIIVMFPFLVQRSTIWESSMFSLLFAPVIIKIILSPRKKHLKENGQVS